MSDSRTPRIALVTGAGTGIGRAAAIALAEEGFSVVLAGRRREPLSDVATELKRRGSTALEVQADVSSSSSVQALFARIHQEWGRLDLLFNNAGTNARAVPMEDLMLEEWRSVIDINLTGVFLCTQQAIKMMKSQSPSGGRIINNGSLSAHVPRPNSAAYTASKSAISGLTRSTALEGREFGIACGQIDIGNAATAIGSHVQQGALQPNGTRVVEPMLDLRHVGEAIKYMARLPLDANVFTMTVMATGMPYVGRG